MMLIAPGLRLFRRPRRLMLLLDRFLGAHFLRQPQAGGSRCPLAALSSGSSDNPEVYILVIPVFAFASEIIPVFSPQSDLSATP